MIPCLLMWVVVDLFSFVGDSEIWVSLGCVSPVGPALRGRVHIWGFVGFVSRVLFPWVLWSMLSGPTHLLSALALGM